MFKHVQSDYHLYVKPGEAIWSIQNNLNFGKIWLKGGRAGQCCPAHPSSSLDPQGDAKNWEIGSGKQKGVKGGVLIRCHSVHTQHTLKWLVDQGREGLISKEKVGALLCEEDRDGSFLLSLLDGHVYTDVLGWWDTEATQKIAHKLCPEFVQWLFKQRMGGHSEGKELGCIEFVRWLIQQRLANEYGYGIEMGEGLGSVVLDFETQKKVAYYEGGCLFSLLDSDMQQEAATWNPEATEKIAHMQSLDFIQWLIRQKLEGHWKGKELESVVWRKNKEGMIVFSQLEFETQKQAAYWSQEETNNAAHLASDDFIQWLILQARDGKWPKKEVGSIVCRKNADNQLILATFDEETQKEVAVFNPSKTCSAVSYMEKEGDFLEWLYQEAVERRWDEHMVTKALVKEEVNGNVKITSRIKPGISLQITLSYPFPTTQSLR